jgi:hypothetical protein
MNKEFIPYEQALELKELGYDEECGAFYFKDLENIYQKFCEWFVSNDDAYYYGEEILCVSPLYQQAFRWFREKYGIMYTVHNNIENWKNTFHGAYSKINSNYESDYTDDYATYEEAELACLKKLIEIVTKNN